MDIIIRGQVLQGDYFDADFIDRYEEGARQMQERSQTIDLRSIRSTGEGFRIICGIIEDFFDYVFGDGTAESLFSDAPGNLKIHQDAAQELIEWAKSQKAELNNMTNRYNQRQSSHIQKGQPIGFYGNSQKNARNNKRHY